ncbi:ArsR/SmtB family transcription factor [Nonomuraea cavernae]|uniref:Transcriptional regulator n=1 Tax=Nonomuraea cavernae TaxID=2045107 RepID=A0A918DVH8_9ACTN|nr:metalloregulator ArsR/SmtB family transcription factor [Nonomuraea cavernae]MCA2190989.1 helix-turn-helix domain-containing protein [Nonomuraea cavernae]GGO83654.1 transcriptional regulator [Nonomuraea cavernae]
MGDVEQAVDEEILRALASTARLDILRWLKDPAGNFGRQEIGDFDVEGVCVSVIQDRAGMSQPAVSAHLKILHQAGLVTRKKIGNWHFYRRDELAIRRFLDTLSTAL